MERPENDTADDRLDRNEQHQQPQQLSTPPPVTTPQAPGNLQSQQQESAATRPRPTRPTYSQLPSIRISRYSVPFLQSVQQQCSQSRSNGKLDAIDGTELSSVSGRRRSSSEPEPQQHVHFTRPTITKVASTSGPPQSQESANTADQAAAQPAPARQGRLKKFESSMGSNRTYRGENPKVPVRQSEYDDELIDWLDLVDPEVSTLSTLTNVQNSLFVPDLGRLLNRRPTYALTRPPSDAEKGDGRRPRAEPRPTTGVEPRPTTPGTIQEESEDEEPYDEVDGADPRIKPSRKPSLGTINSTLSESRFAVLPHGLILEGWSEEDKQELNDHVRHMLHSRRSRFKRRLRGFGQYVRRPLGFFVTLYATLITLFGLAWVLFLIGWVNVGGKQLYIINVIDNVLVALFAIMGDGLAPFRVVDTYHMIFIAHYHHLTWSLREKKALPKLQDHNDLPVPAEKRSADLETETYDHDAEDSVLTQKQQDRLIHHQTKFAKSHTFYKPHETTTHHAFPLRLLVAVVVLLDCHSLFQIALGTCTWSIPYETRPFALTTVILCCSICCNITAGVLIMIGDRRTRKKNVLERMSRQELTEEAIEKVEKKRKERQSVDQARVSDDRLKERGDLPRDSGAGIEDGVRGGEENWNQRTRSHDGV